MMRSIEKRVGIGKLQCIYPTRDEMVMPAAAKYVCKRGGGGGNGCLYREMAGARLEEEMGVWIS
jgi:hypothetical protein